MVIFTCFSSRTVYVDISRDYLNDSFFASSKKVCLRKRMSE